MNDRLQIIMELPWKYNESAPMLNFLCTTV